MFGSDDTVLPAPLVKSERLGDPYIAAGDRAYLIGLQDGRFPPLGSHVPGEMGGLWAHPHKLLDGLWVAVSEAPEGSPRWLPPATRFEVLPWGAVQQVELGALHLRVRRSFVVPDGLPALLVGLEVEDQAGRQRALDLAVVARSKLRPGWLDDRPDGADTLTPSEDGRAVVAHDPTGPWWVAWGGATAPASIDLAEQEVPEPAQGLGATATQRFQISVPAGGVARLVLGVHGSTENADGAVSALRDLLARADALVARKKQRLVAAHALGRLDVPEQALVDAWNWTRFAYDWLAREVPGVGRGLGAGVPEYPWWFACDSSYALCGLLPLGGHELAEQTLRLLADASRRENGASGRIIHELSCTGVVFNPGNTQETPQFACAVLETYLWTGRRALVEDLYELCRDGVLSWTLGRQDADGDLLPEGYGITEVYGLNTEILDTAVWTHEGLCALGRMAAIVGDAATQARCADLAPRLRAEIERRFWQDDADEYADWIATPAQAHEHLDWMLDEARARYERRPTPGTAALIAHLETLSERAAEPQSDEETVWPLANAIVAVPLEVGLAPRERAARALRRLRSDRYLGPHGVYLSGIEHHWAMSISTGYLAAACCAYGQVEQALDLSRLLAGMLTLRMPGAISEMSPDGGCFVQAWSGYGVVYPLAHGVFGLYPDAGARHLVLCPLLPSGWPSARLHGLLVGDAHLDVELERRPDGAMAWRLRVDTPGWRATVVPVPALADLPPLTMLAVHAQWRAGRWGTDASIIAAGQTLDLPSGEWTMRP
jgi:glycogen debranching enzyme